MLDFPPDPSIALPQPAKVTPWREGPMPKVQFVVELVGPRSVPAAAAIFLLDPRWFEALGRPEVWCMGPSDTQWRRMPSTPDGSFDSLALAWDLFSANGRLNGASCASLTARVSEFGEHIQRRAMPMPLPEEVERQIEVIERVREGLDIGFSLAFGPISGSVSENALRQHCARLGLRYSESGAFDWISTENPLPLLSVTPIGNTEAFSPTVLQEDIFHDGASIGFHVPLCPSVSEALVGCFHIGRSLCDSLGGSLFDEDGDPITSATQKRLASEVLQAEQLFQRAGIDPGSAEASRIWG